jgi:hypothetical protein
LNPRARPPSPIPEEEHPMGDCPPPDTSLASEAAPVGAPDGGATATADPSEPPAGVVCDACGSVDGRIRVRMAAGYEMAFRGCNRCNPMPCYCGRA